MMREKAVTFIIKEIWNRRSLIRQLVLKDLKVRYRRPFLGFLWAFLSPFLTVVVLYVVFSVILKLKIQEAPFFLYIMSAVFSWRFFQDALMCSTTSLIDNKNLLKESSFPHYFVPISVVLSHGVIFLPALAILIFFSWQLLKGLPIFFILLPFIVLIHFGLTVGLAIVFSMCYVRWRDIKYLLEPILLFLFYLTPAFYSIELVEKTFPSLLYKVYIYNPFVGVLNFYRLTFFKNFYHLAQTHIGVLSMGITPLGFAILVLWLGFYLYGKFKKQINDYLSY